MVQTWINDVTKAESTLAAITDPDVKFHLKPALIQFDADRKWKSGQRCQTSGNHVWTPGA